MRSIYDNVAVKSTIDPKFDTLGVLITGNGVDTKGYNTAMLKVTLSPAKYGALYATTTAVLEESADNVTYATADDVGGTQIGCSGLATSVLGVVAVARIEGLGTTRKRYIRAKVTNVISTEGNATSGVGVVAEFVLGRAFTNPVNTGVSNT